MTENSKQGPILPVSIWVDQEKYRQPNETFKQKCTRIAGRLSDSPEHFQQFRDILLEQRFLPAGRVQAAIGAARETTPYNCFVSGTIPDSMSGIMDMAKQAAETMRLGGGIGYDFSTLRPRGDNISRTGSPSSGPVSFMRVFDAVCATVASAGHRRGAQMGVLRIDHPDVEEFVNAKNNQGVLTNFNVSLAITDAFMKAVEEDKPFDLVFSGKVYRTINARNLWEQIMRNTWDWAEPGVLFIDRINEYNNLYYCETIAATNPCAEQPLPPYGACLLGSFNLVKYIVEPPYESHSEPIVNMRVFDFDKFQEDVFPVIRAMDNVVDVAVYPLPEQEKEAKSKRRMGIGITGLANAGEALGYRYGSDAFLSFTADVMSHLAECAYTSSVALSREKGAFPLFDKDKYIAGKYIQSLPEELKKDIQEYGIRNSHLISIAPTGTISLVADYISSGIEPVYHVNSSRIIQTYDGPRVETFTDYGAATFGTVPKTAEECSVDDHLNVLLACVPHVDSAVSKTCNVGNYVTFEEFKNVYYKAWKGGAKGCTTFRAAGRRLGILFEVKQEEEGTGAACFVNPETGVKTCE